MEGTKEPAGWRESHRLEVTEVTYSWDGEGGGYQETRTGWAPGDGGEGNKGADTTRIEGDRGCPHLLLQLRCLEGEQELLDMVLAELVDAAGIDGPAQELIHLILRVEGLLGTAARGRGGSGPPPDPWLCPREGPATTSPKVPQHGYTYLSLLESSMPWGDRREMGGVRDTDMDGGGAPIGDKDMGHPSGSPRLPRMGDRVPRVTRMGGNPKGSPSPGKDGGGGAQGSAKGGRRGLGGDVTPVRMGDPRGSSRLVRTGAIPEGC